MNGTSRKVFVCLGLQRSGNHAVLDWVGSLFPAVAFHNDQPHDLFADPDRLRALLEAEGAPATIFSFEDSANRTPVAGQPLLDSVAPFPADAFPDIALHRLVILRDPYNTWASRVAANARADTLARRLTSDPSWPLFRDNWLALAALQADPGWQGVLFNRWKDDAGYRRTLCAAFGGSYSEATLDAIPRQGGGSSFDGVPRPSYGRMAAQWRKYVSAAFLRRLVSHPGHYLKRFVTPPLSGRDLQVDLRWKTLVGRPEGTAILSDRILHSTATGIFGASSLPPAP